MARTKPAITNRSSLTMKNNNKDNAEKQMSKRKLFNRDNEAQKRKSTDSQNDNSPKKQKKAYTTPKDRLYDIGWYTPWIWPCMIIEPKDMSREAQKEFEKWKDPKKLAIRFFCEDSNPYAIARSKEIEPFTNTNTYKYINNIKEDQILASAFTTAYYAAGLPPFERIKIKSEQDAGCCRCFKSKMKTFNDKDYVDYVYCSNCHLNYHIDCSGIDLSKEMKDEFICDKCKFYFSNLSQSDLDEEFLLSQTTPGRIPGDVYDIVWYLPDTWPCLIVSANDLSEKEMKEYNRCKYNPKVPLRYFNDWGIKTVIAKADEIKLFNEKNNIKFMYYVERDSDLAAAYTTAYYCSGLNPEERLNIQSEQDSGCCKCFSTTIKNCKKGLDQYVYCDKCQLAFHLQCVGLKALPDEKMSFICDKCKKYKYKIRN